MTTVLVLIAIFGIMTVAALLHDITKPVCFGSHAIGTEECEKCANKQACYLESRK